MRRPPVSTIGMSRNLKIEKSVLSVEKRGPACVVGSRQIISCGELRCQSPMFRRALTIHSTITVQAWAVRKSNQPLAEAGKFTRMCRARQTLGQDGRAESREKVG